MLLNQQKNIEIKDEEPVEEIKPAAETAVPEAGPEIIEIKVSPETLTAANEGGTLAFGEEKDKPAAAPAPVTEPSSIQAPSFDKPEDNAVKDKKQLKEEKRKKKLDKQKKVRRNDHLSGNDIDMYPEDGES